MGTHVLLNNIDHKDLKVATQRSAALGDNVMSTVAFCNEFRDLQTRYPIVFSIGEQTHPTALMGLEQGENLFLTPAGWEEGYVPLALEMQPFLIGYSRGPDGSRQTVIHVDMDSPRIQETGEPLFLPMGGNAPLLDRAIETLNKVQAGNDLNAEFVGALTEYNLLEPFALDVELADGSSNRLAGFHTVNEERLAALAGTALAALNEKGFLQPIYMAVASLSNFADLVRRKNARITKA